MPPKTPFMESPEDARKNLCDAIGYTFNDAALLDVALTHRSGAFEMVSKRKRKPIEHNERMEFLGDSVLGFVMSDLLWRRLPGATEGELTRVRAAVINEGRLAEVALAAGVGEALKIERGLEQNGGRTQPSLLADALEAIFAAVYLDGGLDAARAVITRMLGPSVDVVLETRAYVDVKTTLQETLQAARGVTPRYELVAEEGTAQQRTSHVRMIAGDVLTTWGSGRNKKAAEQEAARVALGWLETFDPSVVDSTRTGEGAS